ncbi:MAG: TonB-dependent receptor domain-containing protein [Rhodothermaceae bacterium]
MRKLITCSLLIFFLLSQISLAQRKGKGMMRGNFQGTISGTVIDNHDKKPLEYTNVVIFSKRTNKMVTGTITNKDGKFKLEKLMPGMFRIELKYIGYEKVIVDSVKLTPKNKNLDVGEVYIKRAAFATEAVNVTAEKQAIQYKIDKKVINVDQESTTISGTATDVLRNTPSVTVDIEGNVSLRGSTNFTVLIDGKPTILEPSEALEQLPASTIENIEIITNPSAKYDPEGTSGIINIVMKKNKLAGLSGAVNATVGLDDKYGGDVKVNYRNSNYSIDFGADYNKRYSPGDRYSKDITQYEGNTTELIKNGTSSRSRKSYGLQFGFNYNISDNHNFSIGARYGDRDMEGDETTTITEIKSSENSYISKGERSRGGDFYRLNFDYQWKFNNPEHKLDLQFQKSNRDFDELDKTELINLDNSIIEGYYSEEGGPADNYRAKLDYILPIGENGKLEAGAHTQKRKSDEFNKSYQYDPTVNDYVTSDLYSNESMYERNIHSIYGLYKNQIGSFGYQLGMRAELTDRKIAVEGQEEFTFDRWDYFPTIHFSYEIEKQTQFMASYTRRIVRPRGWYLEPFETYFDAYNVRRGNPGLDPQYINSMEAGVNKFTKWFSFSAEAYYRVLENKIERIRSVYAENVFLNTYENVGKSYSLGLELMFKFEPLSFWSLTTMGNVFKYEQEGELDGRSFDNESTNWNARINSDFMLCETTKLQMNMWIDSPSKNAQGERKGIFVVNAALRHEFIKKKLFATLQLRDLFGGFKHEFESYGPGFQSFAEFSRKSPMVTLTFSYRFNNFRDRSKSEREDMEMEGVD